MSRPRRLSIPDFGLRFRKLGVNTPDVVDADDEKKQLGTPNVDERTQDQSRQDNDSNDRNNKGKKRSSGERSNPMRFKKKEEDSKLTLRKIIESARVLPPMFMIVWKISPISCIILVFSNIVTGILPAFESYATARLLDTVQDCVKTSNFDTHSLKYYGGLRLLGSILDNLFRILLWHIEAQIEIDVQTELELKLMNKAITLDLAQFEDPETYSMMREAKQAATYNPFRLIYAALSLSQAVFTLASYSMAIFGNSKWRIYLVISLIHPIISFFNRVYTTWRMHQDIVQRRKPRKMKNYLHNLVTSDEFQKEIKLFDLGQYFIDLYKNVMIELKRSEYNRGSERRLAVTILDTIQSTSENFIYYQVAVQAIHSQITIGDLTFYSTATKTMARRFGLILREFDTLYSQCLRLKSIFNFLELESKIKSPPNPISFHKEKRDGFPFTSGMKIEFRNVTFSYPGKDHPALKDTSLIIEPGEVVALVGFNGAGKSTLIKLLMRLYDVDSGEILINDRNVKDYSLKDFHAAIAANFQDFNKYSMKVRENIGLGDVQKIGDISSVEKASLQSGSDEFISKLDNKYDHDLTKQFEEQGTELSGGEWQKLSLAKAFMRDEKASLLVLDEPTAALDARAEMELFQRLRGLSKFKTTIFISHRFSTVRNADRILVIEDGTVLENGSHTELMALCGRYAELFNMQAEMYK